MKSRIKVGVQLQNIKRYDLDFKFEASHYPVLFNEILSLLDVRLQRQPGQVVHALDCTFGRGGHSQGLMHISEDVQLTAFDQDLEAIEFGKLKFAKEIENSKLSLIHDNFANFPKHNLQKFDFILLDLGVSSPQLDQAGRGFSFYNDGPLDMRMNQKIGVTAEFIINTYSEEDLNKLFQEYGEIYKPYRVTRAICHDRKTQAFQRTQQLAGLIERVDGWRQKGHHPATQYFMALRLAVNQELEVLRNTLPYFIDALNPHGLLAVISFHSLEDRIVKNCFRDSIEGGSLFKKVISPTDEECRLNTRSRSAKLRVFEKNRVQDGLRKYEINAENFEQE